MSQKKKTYTIVGLEAENVKRLRAVSISPKEKGAVVISGRNAQGKSSVLDAILFTLAGKKVVADKPIREGESSATVTLDLGEFTVTSSYRGDKRELKVTHSDGSPITSPQSFLDSLVGGISFDPFDFTRLSPKEQGDTVKKVAGLNFDKLDADRKAAFEDRTIVNREAKSIKARFDAMPIVAAPKEEVVVADLLKKLSSAEEVLRHNEKVRDNLQDLMDANDSIEAQIADLESQLEELRASRERTAERIKNGQAVVAKLADPDTETIRQAIRDADETNRKVKAANERAQTSKALKEKEAEAEKLTASIAEIDAKKVQLLRDATLPIDGLGFDEDGSLLYNGIPFKQASSAEQLRICVAMGLALNPSIRVLLIRDGSLLDADNLATVAQMAEEADAQVWIERVGSGGDGSIIIEDGEVVSNE